VALNGGHYYQVRLQCYGIYHETEITVHHYSHGSPTVQGSQPLLGLGLGLIGITDPGNGDPVPK